MISRALIAILRAYKNHISPMLPASCRFYPTCSSYAMEAIKRHGSIKGGILAVWRVLRCNPFGKGGFDPVPTQFNGFHRRKEQY